MRVQWTRDDDIRHGYYHAVSAQRLDAGLDAAGKVVAWRHRIASPDIGSTFDGKADRISEGELAAGRPRPPPRHSRTSASSAARRAAHVRIGWLRSVYNIFHAFAVQSFIDELAAATGRDPRDMLLEVVGPARILTLAEARRREDSQLRRAPRGAPGRRRPPAPRDRARDHARGLGRRPQGRARARPGRAPQLPDLRRGGGRRSSARDGADPRVDEVWIIADPGPVVNPDRVRSQFEGAVIFGMGAALHGAITAKAGAIEQTNFRDYPIVRMGESSRGRSTSRS